MLCPPHLAQGLRVRRLLLLPFVLPLCASAAPPVFPDGWVQAHDSAAHCHRYVGTAPGGAWRAHLECAWPPGGAVRLSHACSAPAPGPAGPPAGAEALRGFVATGTFAGVRRFDTEQALASDHLAVCEGRVPVRRALPVPGSLSTAWTEHLTGRASGCLWLSLAPMRSSMAGPHGAGPVVHDARDGPLAPRGGHPGLLAECCAPTPGSTVPPAPLLVMLTIDPFPGDPSASSVLDPTAWPYLLFRSVLGSDTLYDRPLTLRWVLDDGREAGVEALQLRRRLSTWSTETDYRTYPDPALFARSFLESPTLTLRLEGARADVRGEARYVTGARTRRFLAACAAVSPPYGTVAPDPP